MYEQYWESDEEYDAKELQEIMRDNFVDNLKKSAQIPLVLPVKDEPQFRRLLTKKALKNEIDEGSVASPSITNNTKSIKVELDPAAVNMMKLEGESIKATSVDTRILSPTMRKNLDAENDASLMLFQMPSSLGALNDSTQRLSSSASQSTQKDTASTSKLNDSSTAAKQEQSMMKSASTSDYQGRSKHCLSGLPTGAEIGKLQILRSGRAIMNIGGHCMDVSEAIPSQCFETAVCIETHPAESNTAGSSIRSSFAPTVNTDNNNSKNNAIYFLGEIPYSFVCAYDLCREELRK